MKVLIVDDNKEVALTAAYIFDALGCRADFECDANKVLTKAQEIKPELVILDIGMPEINGYELCRALRNHGHEKARVLAHTGMDSKTDKQKAREAGFDGLLVKPVSMQQYQAILDNYESK